MSDHIVSLTDKLSAFVEEQVRAGHHPDASAVVCEALRRYAEDLMAERANLTVIARVATQGIAAIERGDYALVSGPDGEKALLERVNQLVVKNKPPRG